MGFVNPYFGWTSTKFCDFYTDGKFNIVPKAKYVFWLAEK